MILFIYGALSGLLIGAVINSLVSSKYEDKYSTLCNLSIDVINHLETECADWKKKAQELEIEIELMKEG